MQGYAAGWVGPYGPWPGPIPVDPSPWPGGGGGGFGPRPVPWPGPIPVDPSPWPGGGGGGFGPRPMPWPGPIPVDPSPWPGGGGGGFGPRPVPWPGPIPVDPSPWPGGGGGGFGPRPVPWPGPIPGDPAPWDLGSRVRLFEQHLEDLLRAGLGSERVESRKDLRKATVGDLVEAYEAVVMAPPGGLGSISAGQLAQMDASSRRQLQHQVKTELARLESLDKTLSEQRKGRD